MSRFDSSFYLSRNPDVAAAVTAGAFTAEQHFEVFGRREGRDPSAFFDTKLYLQQNPDVASAVAAGSTTAFGHHQAFGRVEGRTASAVFSPSAYLSANPDVAGAVFAGQMTAWDHFVTFGIKEPRALGNGISLANFAYDPVFTAAIASGNLETAFDRVTDVAIFTPGFTPPTGTDLTALWQRYGSTIPNDWVGPATAPPLAVPSGLTLPPDTPLGSAFAGRTDPVVLSVTAPSGEYRMGQSVTISVAFDQPVVVAGATSGVDPVSLGINGPGPVAYAGGSGTNTLQFTYTYSGAAQTLELDYTSTSALALASGVTMRSLTGREAVLTLPSVGSAKSLSGTSTAVIDGQAPAPTLTSAGFATDASTLTLTGAGFSGFLPFGNNSGSILSRLGGSAISLDLNNDGTIDATLGASSFSDATVNSDTSLVLSLTSAARAALTGLSGFGSADGTFDRLTMVAGFASDVAGNSSAASGTVQATVGAVATVGVVALGSPTPSVARGIGQTVSVTVQFGGTVTVTGAPTLALSSGGTATYASGSGTNTLTFSYTVASGQNSTDLDAQSSVALQVIGGSISDQFGRPVTPTVPTGTATGSLAANAAIVIDGTAPSVSFQGIQYLAASDQLLIDGLALRNMLGTNELSNPAAVDFRTRLDLGRFVFDLTNNGADGTDIPLSLATVQSAVLASDASVLTIQLNAADATTLETALTANPGWVGRIQTGFARDQVLNASTTDAVVSQGTHNVVNGGSGNDMLSGGFGRDTITGGDGADTLQGGQGADTLTGGTGADSFIVGSWDLVTDFTPGQDRIGLTNSFFANPLVLPTGFQGQAVNPANTLATNLASLTVPTLTSGVSSAYAISGTDVTFTPANLVAIDERIAQITSSYTGGNRAFYFISSPTETRIVYDDDAFVAGGSLQTIAILPGVTSLALSDFTLFPG
ncbi:MAG: hypothetical protein EAZ99_07500 [Alphaproteobacteria bacterium]|nr:MAG: hypothetical protein EAZ99_07500 [Alphaproteobacteria bacterium]